MHAKGSGAYGYFTVTLDGTLHAGQARFGNTAGSTADAPLEIQPRHIRNRSAADPACGKGVAGAVEIAKA